MYERSMASKLMQWCTIRYLSTFVIIVALQCLANENPCSDGDEFLMVEHTQEGQETYTCIDCTECPEGTGALSQCAGLQDTVCKNCTEGVSYSDDTLHYQRLCQPCTSCIARHKVTVEPCTLYYDAQCGACLTGYVLEGGIDCVPDHPADGLTHSNNINSAQRSNKINGQIRKSAMLPYMKSGEIPIHSSTDASYMSDGLNRVLADSQMSAEVTTKFKVVSTIAAVATVALLVLIVFFIFHMYRKRKIRILTDNALESDTLSLVREEVEETQNVLIQNEQHAEVGHPVVDTCHKQSVESQPSHQTEIHNVQIRDSNTTSNNQHRRGSC